MMERYRSWCAEEKRAALDLDGLVVELRTICGKRRIDTIIRDDKLVYCVNLKLADPNVFVFPHAFRAQEAAAQPAAVKI